MLALLRLWRGMAGPGRRHRPWGQVAGAAWPAGIRACRALLRPRPITATNGRCGVTELRMDGIEMIDLFAHRGESAPGDIQAAGAATTRQRAPGARWGWLHLGVMAVLALAGSAVLVPSQPALAETALTAPVPV